ncbi:MAG: hypothetical protein XD78_2048 [Desulfotomaculum sp. 46_296]|nr:MAG: hypothetical protein XD78_2048 [Desulfotomaculum sp. 46_296]
MEVDDLSADNQKSIKKYYRKACQEAEELA